MPPTYICQRCTACCRWPGFVRVTGEEIRSIAAHLGMQEEAFIQNYTRLRPNRGGLALIDRPDGSCFFLDEVECSIQEVKPQQCRDFPNAWNFPGWRDVCKAIETPSQGGERDPAKPPPLHAFPSILPIPPLTSNPFFC